MKDWMTPLEQVELHGYVLIDPETGETPVPGKVWPPEVDLLIARKAAEYDEYLAKQSECEKIRAAEWSQRQAKLQLRIDTDKEKPSFPLAGISYELAVDLEDATWNGEYGERQGCSELINQLVAYYPSLLDHRNY